MSKPTCLVEECFWKPYWVLCITLCFFQEGQKPIIKKDVQEFLQSKSKSTLGNSYLDYFYLLFVKENNFCAGAIFRKDAIYKCELKEASMQVGYDIASSYTKEVSR